MDARHVSALPITFVAGVALACGASGRAQERPAEPERPAPTSGAASTAPAAASVRTGDPRYVHPAIAGFGRAAALPNAVQQPRQDVTYRVLFDVTSGPESPDKPNPGLAKVARFLNVFATAGVEAEDMELVLVVHGDATWSVVEDGAYRARHDVPNPNAPLLRALADHGVTTFVCGQALAHREISGGDVLAPVDIALAAFTVQASYGLEGYVELAL